MMQILIYRADARLKGDRSPFNTSSSDLPEILRISGRQICKVAFFALVDRLPAAKKAPPAAYTPPRTIKDRGAPPVPRFKSLI